MNSHNLTLYVTHNSGAGNASVMSSATYTTNAVNDRDLTIDLTTVTNPAGAYTIGVWDGNNYVSPQSYNLVWEFIPGI